MALPEGTRGIAPAGARLARAGGLAVVVAAAVYAVGRPQRHARPWVGGDRHHVPVIRQGSRSGLIATTE